jgi:hypothetical protein
MPELKIVITAENQKALTELTQLQDKLFKLQEEVKNYKGDWPLTHIIETQIPKIQARIKELQGTLSQAGVAFDNFGNETQKIALGSNKAGLALNDLSRIAQDAPYGFIGISNNLNPMIESFGRLAATEGGTKKALLAMFDGLAGPAGIGLAIGAVSALLVVFSKNISELFKKPTDDLLKFKDELNKISEQIYKLIGEEQTKRTKGILLSEIIVGGNKTQQEEALKELKKLYSDNKDIQDAKLGADKIFYTTLVNQASIQGSAIANEKNNVQQLDKLYQDQLQNEKKRNDKLAELDKGIGLGFFKAGKNAYQERIDYLKVEVNKSFDILGQSIEKEAARLESNTFKQLSKITNTSTLDKNANKELKQAIEEKISILEWDIKKTLIWAEEEMKIHEKVRISARDAFTISFAESLPDKTDKAKAGLPDWYLRQHNGENPAEKKIDKELPDWIKKEISLQNENSLSIARQYNEYKKFANILANDVTNGLQSAYDAMQKGENPIQALGDAFAKMAEQIALAIVQAYIFEAILNAFPELKGLFATIGIISKVGSASGGYSGGLADGGITNGASLATIGEAGPEAIMPLSKLSSFLNTSFNAGAMNGSTNTNGGQFVLRGNDLVLALQRSNYSLNLRRGS